VALRGEYADHGNNDRRLATALRFRSGRSSKASARGASHALPRAAVWVTNPQPSNM
jgi:hypothetical protein